MTTNSLINKPIDMPGDGESISEFSTRFFHPKQIEFLASPATFRAAVSGIGGGKTILGCLETIRHALKFPGSMHIIVAPTYRMLEQSTWKCLKKVLQWWGDDLQWTENISKKTITFDSILDKHGNPSIILSGNSLDSDKLRGIEISTFFIDEASLCKKELFDILVGRIRQPGYVHRGWLTTSPRGFDWVYQMFVEQNDPDYKFITWTTKDNPLYIKEPDYLNNLIKRYGENSKFYRQEVLGEFVKFEGLVYDLKDIHISTDKPKNPSKIVVGVDWGITAPGAMVVVALDVTGIVYVLDEICRKDLVVYNDGVNDWVGMARDLQQKYTVDTFFGDPADPNAIQTLLLNGINIFPANNRRLPGIRECINYFEGNKIKINPECINLIDELRHYEWKQDKNTNYLIDIDAVKINDHSCDALRYAIMGLNEVVESDSYEILTLEDFDIMPESLGAAKLR